MRHDIESWQWKYNVESETVRDRHAKVLRLEVCRIKLLELEGELAAL